MTAPDTQGIQEHKTGKFEKLAYIGLVITLGVAAVHYTNGNGLSVEDAENGQRPKDATLACPIYAEEYTAESAKTCEQLRQHGKIAIVGYEQEDWQLSALANKTQQEANKAFGTSLTVTPVQISDEATKQIKEHLVQTDEGICIEPGEIESAVSLTARATMHEELAGYDTVVGISSLPSCDESVGGVYMGTNLGGAIEATEVTDITGAETIVHELGHMVGLGHSAEFYAPDYKPGTYHFPYVYTLGDVHAIDLSNIFNESEFETYGDGCTIMGSGNFCSLIDEDGLPVSHYKINTVQKALLEWPDQILHNKPSRFVSLTAGAAPIKLSGGENAPIAELDLEAPLIYDGFNGGTNGSFGKLGFTLNCDRERTYESGECVDIYFYNETSTAYVGSIAAPSWEPKQGYLIKMHGQTVAVSFKKDTVTVKAVS